ncbi:EspA/EspE family type VII secretion system effector [Mycobacterium marinum]|uniref:EspA/EspE family type VII secretion system effector n=2 Tax=Mycobacterium marinum TaxID=1781 RepID=UPI0023419359|nr:EspA/EspE family type VII secretion system effector [Mycobacterium marinum]MDC8997378.1 EspA/EspE family type VII secretion system effector [Mycobacterium marinum]WDZ13984.1 EspA/EspE family type VII secretion system effector [Mycobacterium marinum]
MGWLGHEFPDQGDGLVSSGLMFDQAAARIAVLGPDGGWQGSAARTYVARNLAHSRHATLMADLDRLTAELVSSQAEAVKKTRDHLWLLIAATFFLLLICLVLESLGPNGQADSFLYAVIICTGVLSYTTFLLYSLAGKTSQNASAMQTVKERLSNMLTARPTWSGAIPDSPEMGVPPTDSLSEFDPTDSSAASPPHLPDLDSAFADLPGAPEFHLPTAAGAGLPDFGAPQLPIPALTDLPTLPDPTNPTDLSSMLAGLPTITQLPAILGQLNNLAGPTSAVSQLANTATQHAQMISTLAQQGAHQHTTLTDHHTTDETPDTDAATAATSSGERAPLDTTTHPTQHRLDHIV